ncbi:MAG: DNA repair protein RecN [Pseudomonadales bacterium]|nr:DNA repair protein RecN [Pseudomonadales bacterium]NIX09387.1 DNA repair protein RecN [Pseudomonadales bacterium]
MLRDLLVRDFALVESLEISLSDGLTVITGESGAGKSILLGALGLVLGDRADTDTIRPGAQRADVSAEFDLSSQPAALAFLAEHDLEDADHPERCLVRRVVNQEGRSRAFINGAAVTRALLREFAEDLVDIHGQHEHQRLAEPATQLKLLDDYGVDANLLASCRESYRSWQRALADANALEDALASKQDRASLLSYQLEELAALGLQPGEFEILESEHKRLSQAQDLRETVGHSLAALEEAEVLGRVAGALANLDDEHPALQAARDLMSSADSLVSDAVRDLRRYDDSLDVDQEELQQLEARVSSVVDLARKHRVPPAELVEHMATLQAELDAISTDRGSLDALRDDAARHEAKFRNTADEVSRQRREAASPFAAAVSQCMQNLGIGGGELRLAFSESESERGLESVEYQVMTNPKYPEAPLARIASGGERARISLAIQVVAAEKSALPCLVLDEADVGIGGTTADVLGRLLRSLAMHTQVICVTHAPQVAALGNHHLRVTKSSDQDTHIERLSEDTRIDEVARMLAGSGVTDKSRDYARTLLDEAHQALH